MTGGVELIKMLNEYGADLDARNPKDWQGPFQLST